MDDSKQPTEAINLPLQGPHWHTQAGPREADPFYPLRLVLYPGGCAVDLTKSEVVVGRHSTADVRLHLPDVSRRHCRFLFAGGCWQVFDLHSMNGLFINDERVEQAVVHPGDLIRIGSYIFEVQLPDDAPSAPMPSPGLRTLENIAGALPRADEGPKRQAS